MSFGTLAFYGVNAFKFTNAQGAAHFVRYQILPAAGEQALSEAEAKKEAPDYLMSELPCALPRARSNFGCLAQLAKEGDVTNDGTVVWPADRELVELGTPQSDQRRAGSGRRAEGDHCSLWRCSRESRHPQTPCFWRAPAAYAVSYSRRLQ